MKDINIKFQTLKALTGFGLVIAESENRQWAAVMTYLDATKVPPQ